jgi:hypothetical protein
MMRCRFSDDNDRRLSLSMLGRPPIRSRPLRAAFNLIATSGMEIDFGFRLMEDGRAVEHPPTLHVAERSAMTPTRLTPAGPMT